MQPGTKRWFGWIVVIAAVALAGYLFSGVASTAFGAGAGVLLALVYLAAYIVLVLAIPLALFTLARFVFSLWLKPWYRAWHISRIRNARDLREVLDRGKSGGP